MTHKDNHEKHLGIYFTYKVDDYVLTFDALGNPIAELCGRITEVTKRYGVKIRSTDLGTLNESFRFADRIESVHHNPALNIFDTDIKEIVQKLKEQNVYALPGWVVESIDAEVTTEGTYMKFANGWSVQFVTEANGEYETQLVTYTYDTYGDIRHSTTQQTEYR
ncbi:hypothetical protein MA9V1_064 [Chryseobacterium phage MA9V-1]|nr:hypothetical protein MA9V1_064 [Chryseobacterium phage MA9V-1]